MPKFLEKKYGPFQGWQWALMILGGAAIGLYLRSRNSSTPAPAGSGSGAVPDSLPGGHSAGGAINVPYGIAGESLESDFYLDAFSEVFASSFEQQQSYFQTEIDRALGFFEEKSLEGTRTTDTSGTDTIVGGYRIEDGIAVEYVGDSAPAPTNTGETWVLRKISGGPSLGTFESRLACARASGGDTTLGCYKV